MICPSCYSEECRRSHRGGSTDFLIGVSGLRPWRCQDCRQRFYAWSVPISFVRYAHCEQCGNLGVKRISGRHVTSYFAWLFRTLRFPAYRCAPCRNKFFSFRRHIPVVPEPRWPAPAETESAAAPGTYIAQPRAWRKSP